MAEIKNQVQYRPIKELKELSGNPRIIKKDQFEKLKTSIKDNRDYFEARPIILSDRTGELVILAGNQRYKAAKALGLEDVPTILLPGLTEQREKEIIIRDNVENGDWDYDILFNEWDTDDLQEWGVDNIKKSIQDEKDIQNDAPTIVTSFITLDYTDEIQLAITDDTAMSLMEEMIKFKEDRGTYDGFWDERLKNE